VAEVADGVTQITDKLDELAPMLDTAADVLAVLPDALGASGPKSYLLLFQNNGEVTVAGGTVGSLAQLDLVDGRVSLGTQLSANDFTGPRAFSGPVVSLPDDAVETAMFGLGEHVQRITQTPRFEYSYAIAQEMWRRTTGTTVNGVVAIDVVVLQRLIAALGPVDAAPGVQFTADNVIPLLFGDLYYVHTPAEVDEINQNIAGLVFAKLMAGGDVDPLKLLDVITKSAEEHRVLMWTDDPAQQQLIRESPFY